jgi:hypothetical protein
MNIIQILPDFLTNKISLDKGICIKIKKNFTGDVLKFLKNFNNDNENSAFYVNKENQNFKDLFKNKNKNNNEVYKYGKYNLRNKNIICVKKTHILAKCKGKKLNKKNNDKNFIKKNYNKRFKFQ